MNAGSIGTAAIVGLLVVAAPARAAVQDVVRHYNPQGALVFSAERGKEFWSNKTTGKDGKERDCGTCHGADLTKPGKHEKTGKVIEPMAPSVNYDRLTDVEKVEKWFKRNCKETIGRECTDQEKGDVLSYLSQL